MKQTILTPSALEKLKKELQERKNNRKAMSERIERAKDFGDLSENFEYHEAKDAQGMNEGRIIELESLIKSAIIQEKTSEGGAIEMNSEVTVSVNGNEMNFTIVSFNEADPSNGLISNESPIGAALMGHKKGDEVAVEMPNGTVVTYQIINVI